MDKIQEITARYVLPTVEEKTAYGFKRQDPYTKLFEERIIFMGQPIDDTSFTALTAIYDTMQFVRPDISTICLGQAASAAAVILAGGAKGKRYALEHSRILIHQPSSEGGGQASDIEIQAKEIDRITRLQEDLLARHVIKSSEEIRKDIERDKILTSAEAVEYGIIDQVLASRKAKK